MSDLPNSVEFHEEGPREGFQIEKCVYPLEQRAALIDALSATGLKQIQVASFVNQKMVPQMADAEQLFAAIKRRAGVRYTGLWLNKTGFQRAANTPGVDLDGKIMFYTTDAFSQHNNGCSAAEMRDKQAEWVQIYDQHHIPLEQAYIMTAWGCNFQGDVPLSAITDTVKFIIKLCRDNNKPLPNIYLADTVGWATPEKVKQRLGAVRDLVPEARLGLHLHDTRGAGAANVYAALQMGVQLFDSSVAGLGGCPFANHSDSMAAGNVCTEDMVFMCEEMGIATGIDLDALIQASRLAEKIIGRKLNGRVMHGGSLSKYRKNN